MQPRRSHDFTSHKILAKSILEVLKD